MHIDNVFCYDYDNFFDNILRSHDETEKHLIKNRLLSFTNNITDKECLCYMDLFDCYGHSRYGGCILKNNIEKFFPIHDVVYEDNEIQICHLYSKDLKEYVTLMFTFVMNNECKVFFSSNNFMRTIDKVFSDPQHDSIYSDICIYVPRVSNIRNFRFLHNSPPYFFVNDIDHTVHDLPIGEYIGVESDYCTQSRYTQFIKNYEETDHTGNTLSLNLYKISNDKFDKYIKLMNAEIRSYYWIDERKYFMVI